MIDILLAAYNGERYLPALSRSLRSQSHTDFTVLCRDDGSRDATPSLLAGLEREDRRFRLVYGQPSGSASGCFFALLRTSDAPYTMFCDQDDVWHPDKVEKTLRAMKEAEARYGPDTPLLVHTDLRVVDAVLRELSPSMMTLQQLCPGDDSLARLLCQSLVSGCTMMINAPLRRLVTEHLPDSCLMYDWWISLAAAAFGRIVYLDEATIDYRQHGGNQVGAKNVRSPAYVLQKFRGSEGKSSLAGTYRQAAAFAGCFGELLPRQEAELVRGYAALPELGKLRRIRSIRRMGTLKCGTLRRLGQYWFV